MFGTVASSQLQGYEIQLGQGPDPTQWKTVVPERRDAVDSALLGAFPAREITARGQWTVRVVARDGSRQTRESRSPLNVQ